MNDDYLQSPGVEPPLSGWKKLKLIAEVIGVRIRFIAILAITMAGIGYWDTITNYWDKWTRPAATATAGQLPADKEFFCPMHPKVVRTNLDPDGSVPKCPICGMPLSLRTKGATVPLPQGVTARVQLSPYRIQLAGIETAEVKYRPMSKQISTVGTVAYDESRQSRVVSRTSGYVEKLYIDKTFVKVSQGDPLAEIYSPDLYSTAQEMLSAAKGGAAGDMVASARRRLKLFGMSDRDIDAILSAGAATPRLVIRSPRSGCVTRKAIVAGARVEDGMTLLEIADLSAVWIEADVYEKDISFVHEGQSIEAAVEALPNRTFIGKVALVYPQLDAATRTNRVRFAVANAGDELRPGMYASIRINVPLHEVEPFKGLKLAAGGEVLTVPERAVIDTGAKQIVYIEHEPGVFDGIEVQLGPRSGEYFAVVKGLKHGDRVAAAGAFLIDAETRLNPAAASTYFGASGGPQSAGTSGKTPAAQTPAAPAKLTDEQLKNIAKLSAADQALARAQMLCPITGLPLGSMGVPQKLTIKGQTVFLCCTGCIDAAKRQPDKVLKRIAELKEQRQP
jgi:multidrug efflux pump subunit AcrA (membrane-fusion protein)